MWEWLLETLLYKHEYRKFKFFSSQKQNVCRTQSEITIPQYGSIDNRSETNENQQNDSIDKNNKKPSDGSFVERIRKARLESEENDKAFISSCSRITIGSSEQ